LDVEFGVGLSLMVVRSGEFSRWWLGVAVHPQFPQIWYQPPQPKSHNREFMGAMDVQHKTIPSFSSSCVKSF
jgi:hypothetical protein